MALGLSERDGGFLRFETGGGRILGILVGGFLWTAAPGREELPRGWVFGTLAGEGIPIPGTTINRTASKAPPWGEPKDGIRLSLRRKSSPGAVVFGPGAADYKHSPARTARILPPPVANPNHPPTYSDSPRALLHALGRPVSSTVHRIPETPINPAK